MIQLDVSDRVAIVTLDDPDRRNTISSALNAELIATMDELEGRDDVGAVVVTGAGKAFCAGADLDDLAACRDEETLRGIYAGLPAGGRLPAADGGRGQRRRGRGRPEHGAGLRPDRGRRVGPLRHPLPPDRPAPRRRQHLAPAPHHRPPDDDGAGGVRRGRRRPPGGRDRAGVVVRAPTPSCSPPPATIAGRAAARSAGAGAPDEGDRAGHRRRHHLGGGGGAGGRARSCGRSSSRRSSSCWRRCATG